MKIIRQLPNILTTLRLFLALPICMLILDGNYVSVLVIALVAGCSDGVDGWLARKLNATSRYGAVVDPISDKVLLTTTYISLALVGLLPSWLAVIVVLRDGVIFSGALAYHYYVGRYDMEPSGLGKASTFVQICYALLLISDQSYEIFHPWLLEINLWLVILLAFISGIQYVFHWGRRALSEKHSD